MGQCVKVVISGVNKSRNWGGIGPNPESGIDKKPRGANPVDAGQGRAGEISKSLIDKAVLLDGG